MIGCVKCLSVILLNKEAYMATPAFKSPQMENLLETIFGRTTAIESNKCSFCGFPAKTFDDPLSEKEYTISGLCQICQDEAFGE